MENRRFMLLALIGVIVYFLYQAWQTDFAPKPAPSVAQATPQIGTTPTPPGTTQASVNPGPGNTTPSLAPTSTPPGGAAPAAADTVVHLRTDVLAIDISTRGGVVRRVELLHYPVSKKDPQVPLPLLNDGEQYFVLESGLVGADAAHPFAAPDTAYTAQQTQVELAAGASAAELTLTHEDPAGVTVTKTFKVSRGSYRIEVAQTLRNNSANALSANPYAKFVRNTAVVGEQPKFAQTSIDVGYYQQDGSAYKFKDTPLKKLAENPVNAAQAPQTGGWIAMLQRYFVAAILPPEGAQNTFSAGVEANDHTRFNAQYVGSGTSVAAGASQTFPMALYIGPKLQDGLVPPEGASRISSFFKGAGLDTVATGLDYTVNYGWLTPICEPLFWVMLKFHHLTGNWGVSIMLLTLVVKAVFYKLSEAQFRSMAKMKKFAPRIQELKERYAGDQQRQSKAMMDLYKKEGFNPVAGCFPLLVTLPVFYALYRVLQESVELRQAGFALWLNDLSAPDPFYVLPLLWGATFWFQQKWSGSTAAMDPMQQRVMNIMPITMTAFFTQFQAGLVLYWLTSNVIGMAQQWLINQRLEKEGLGRKAQTAA